MLNRLPLCLIIATVLGAICAGSIFAQQESSAQGEDIRLLKLRDWQPRSMLKTKVTAVDRPKFLAIDAHNHLGGGAKFLTPQRVRHYLDEMDAAGVETVVNLDGGWGAELKETLAALDEAHPGRFLTFALVNFEGIDDEDWGPREAKRLEESFKAGAKGLKFHKSLGLTVRYKNGQLMPVDDPKLDPVWEMCAKYRRPVMIHSSDPAAFFTPLDRFNERWHELNEHPDWLFADRTLYPTRDEILAQRNRMIAKHPNTTFICAHMGNNPEDLAAVGRWLDLYPNMVIDIDARISELGRQPYTARRFFLKYQDRVLFGTDTTPRREAFRINYRFLETDDEYFDCRESHHLQGFWMIYGIYLPDSVLKKVYRDNALKFLYFGPKKETTPGPEKDEEPGGSHSTGIPSRETAPVCAKHPSGRLGTLAPSSFSVLLCSASKKTLSRPEDGRLQGHRRRRSSGLGQGPVAPAVGSRPWRDRLAGRAIQDALLRPRPVRADGRGGSASFGLGEGGFRRSVDRRRL